MATEPMTVSLEDYENKEIARRKRTDHVAGYRESRPMQ